MILKGERTLYLYNLLLASGFHSTVHLELTKSKWYIILIRPTRNIVILSCKQYPNWTGNKKWFIYGYISFRMMGSFRIDQFTLIKAFYVQQTPRLQMFNVYISHQWLVKNL